jgi:hypothetical protein
MYEPPRRAPNSLFLDNLSDVVDREVFILRRLQADPVIMPDSALSTVSAPVLTELLEHSKCLMRLLAAGSRIVPTRLLAVVHPELNFTGNYDLPTADGVRKRLVPPCIPGALEPSPKELSLSEFVQNFCEQGVFPETVAFKPDGAGGGKGLLKLTRHDSEIIVVIPQINAPGVRSTEAILAIAEPYVTEHTPHSHTLRIPPDPLKLEAICRAALTTVFPHQEHTPFGYTDINSGLVEAWTPFHKINGSVVEGRYFLFYTSDMIGLGGAKNPEGGIYGSYLKRGNTDWYVNDGAVAAVWPNMHAELISSLGLECSSTEFNLAMAINLFDHIGQMVHNYGRLVYPLDEILRTVPNGLGVQFAIDVAWANEIAEVPLESLGGKKVAIPRPVWLESSLCVPRVKHLPRGADAT